MIEVARKPGFDFCDVFVNQKKLANTKAYLKNTEWGYSCSIYSKSKGDSKILIKQKIDTFPQPIFLSLDELINIEHLNFTVLISHLSDETVYLVKIYSEGNLKEWKNPFSFKEFITTFSEIWNSNYNNEAEFKVYDSNYTSAFEIGFELNETTITIEENIKPFELKLEQSLQKTYQILNLKYQINSLNLSFNLPEETKVFCEQYLLYFTQFLQDLGINTTSNLKQEAGKVLFSVTPTDDIEALDKIRKALAIYLHLPSSPIVFDESFAAMRLQQQIENLQHSQRMTEREIRSSERELRLAQIVIEHQDKLIIQKDTVIGQQNRIIEKITSKSIMMDSLENKEEFEKVFDGLEFGESKELKEKLGIKFNPITSMKSLGKKLSGRDEEITSLNLNEEADKNN